MGLIGGIVNLKSQSENSGIILRKILDIQRHRDQSAPVIFSEKGYALGMANIHNNIYASSNKIINKFNLPRGIFVFLDGIVLKNEYQIPDASCCDIISLAYEKWGLGFMSHLEGEFACAVWDDKEKTLILARDPYGHKPLHYCIDNEKTIFSSEIKGILAAGVRTGLDLVALSDFLSLKCIPCPGTIFKNIKQVPPGQMVIISRQGIKIKQYWHTELTENKELNFDDAVASLTDGIRQAVKKRMVKDDVFCFLSGGLDTSAILSFAGELSNKPVNAVTIGFDEPKYDELTYAIAMAKHAGAKHYHLIAKPDSFFEILDTLVYHHDQPFTDISAYPTYYAGKLARGYTDVILTGDGPDQTMAGSSQHVFAVKNNIFKPRNSLVRIFSGISDGLLGVVPYEPYLSLFFNLRRILYRSSLPPVTSLYDRRSYFPNLVKKYLASRELWQTHIKNNPFCYPESWFKEAGNISDINKYLFADIKFYIPDDLMVKVDRMTMANGLETLSPFQDIKLAQIVNKLPGNFKIKILNDGEIITKYILREVCKKRLPEAILKKKKLGFGIPLLNWLRKDYGNKLKEILLDPRALNRGYFHKKIMIKFVNDFIDFKGDSFYARTRGMFALLTLELWHRRYLDRNI